MTRRSRPLTLDDLPRYASDDQLGEAVLGPERKREFAALATLCEPEGMPKISTFWGGRYVPAVKAFLDRSNGLGGPTALAPGGRENPEGWHRPTPRGGKGHRSGHQA